MWHWPFLAQPEGLPEALIGSSPESFVRYILAQQSAPGFTFLEQNVADYVACGREPDTVRGWCEDYRAGWGIDRRLDEADRNRKLAMLLLILWASAALSRARMGLKLWRRWAMQVEGEALPCGHFIPEEQPAMVVDHFQRFFGGQAS